MKRFALFLLLAVMTTLSFAQVKQPVKWSFKAKKIGADQFELQLTATIEKGWHIYSQSTPPDGPLPSKISFTRNPLVTLQGPVKELGKLEKHFEKMFDVEVKQYSDKVTFVQLVKLRKKGIRTTMTGEIDFMVCNDKECLPPTTQKFTVALK